MKWRVRNPFSVHKRKSKNKSTEHPPADDDDDDAAHSKMQQQFSSLSEIEAHQQLQDADQAGGGDSTEETCVRIPGEAVVNLEATALGSISIFKMFCDKRKR
jgi:hypothetical protein